LRQTQSKTGVDGETNRLKAELPLEHLYCLRRRIPAIAAHFLNDATALPWVTFFMVTAH
jgi:hypothetical protein